MPHFMFKSYSWAVGTTSFRTVDFNVRIERQLDLLDKFWSLPENSSEKWTNNNSIQERYYYFIQEQGFVDGIAARPAKDARQKTSGLVDIGLLNDERRITPAGKALLDVARQNDFSRDNPFQIAADSFIYLKQLLKTSNNVDGDIIRPFAVTVYALLRLGYLTDEEFTYLLPLCTTYENTKSIIGVIKNLHDEHGNDDGISKTQMIYENIAWKIMSMDNYKEALNYFLSEQTITESVITTIGMNRKSKNYDKPYFEFYKHLHSVIFKHDKDSVLLLFEQSKKLNGRPAVLWRQYLFNTTFRSKVERDKMAALNDVPLLKETNEFNFKSSFFELLHLFKARAALHDYADLNRRYFKTTEIIIFADSKMQLDTLPRCWLHLAQDDLLNIVFTHSDKLTKNAELHEIAPFLEINESRLFNNLETLYGITVANNADVSRVITNERYKRFNAMIDERFNRETLIDLLNKFEKREDDAIRHIVTNNANIPTIFEYVLGISWYLISNRCGDVLSYMNLSLEADLLPRSHATGGNADIEYIYEQTSAYPAHTLLLEATLSDKNNQRRMEMEPVSRHLGEYILSTGDKYAYCVFLSTYLNPNVISDYRNRRTYEYYGDQYENVVKGLKILPLATAELRTILEQGIGYDTLYALFESAYRSNEPVPTWYEREIINKID